jgi:hypothetical protein
MKRVLIQIQKAIHQADMHLTIIKLVTISKP